MFPVACVLLLFIVIISLLFGVILGDFSIFNYFIYFCGYVLILALTLVGLIIIIEWIKGRGAHE